MRCEIDILFLRPDPPGKLLQSGDIDNRLKTVFDALKMPSSLDEAGGKGPQEDESPFFVLLEDDKLISSVSIKTDTLLEPTSSAMTNDISDARLVIHVRFWPIRATWSNIDFI
jgi:hypothetical protein